MGVIWPIHDDGGPLGEAVFEPNGTYAVLVYRVPWDDRKSALEVFLGINYRDGAVLRRQLPERHPDWDWLWAQRVNVRGLGKGLKDVTGIGSIDRFEEGLIFTVQYQSLPYPVKEDNQVTKEYERFVTKIPGPRVETIQLEGGQFKFVAPAPSAEERANIGENFLVGKVAFRWLWHKVPDRWVMDALSYPTNIAQGVGTINNALFESFPAGSLYLESVLFTPSYDPIRTLQHGLAFNLPALSWDVEFQFIHFKEGWNNVLDPKGYTWQPIEHVPTGKTLFAPTNFDNLFAAT